MKQFAILAATAGVAFVAGIVVCVLVIGSLLAADEPPKVNLPHKPVPASQIKAKLERAGRQ